MKVLIDGKAVVMKGKTVKDVLLVAKINPETVLVKKKNILIPIDALLKEGDSLETIKVISGG